ncbi:DUF6059 family protein [Streptomyces gardneri]|uniref:DUF6059 family protein n=1 Tax=Streptomyces gardneri TaxID=66892 RepID=UPI003679A2F1
MHGEPNRALGHVVRVALGCYRALVAFGSLWLPLPEDQLRRIVYGETEEHGSETGTGSWSGSGTTATATAPPPPTGPSGNTDGDSARDTTADSAKDRPTGPATAGNTAGSTAGRTTGRTARRAARTLRTPPGPPPGHPERLCVEVPLSELEMRLARQLKGV